MLNIETFDPQTRLLQTDVKALLHEQIALKRKISIIEKRLEGHVAEMRKFMANNGYKKIELQGLRLVKLARDREFEDDYSYDNDDE